MASFVLQQDSQTWQPVLHKVRQSTCIRGSALRSSAEVQRKPNKGVPTKSAHGVGGSGREQAGAGGSRRGTESTQREYSQGVLSREYCEGSTLREYLTGAL